MILKYKEVEGDCLDCIFYKLKTTKNCALLFDCDLHSIFEWTTVEDEDGDDFVLELE